MGELRVAFWNVKDLFEPGTFPDRGPKGAPELEAKVSAIAHALRALFDGSGPDLIGLAEIHTPRILDLLTQQLTTPYRVLWEPCRARSHPQTGLAVLARRDLFASLKRVAAYSGPTTFGRPRFLIAECKAIGIADSLFFVVNHWRSRYSVAGSDDARDRLETAQALGDWLARSPRDTCAVVVGDFNAEPYEEPFGEFGLGSRRHFGPRLRLPRACLYNTAWRFLAEPDPAETIALAGAGYSASRPRTTFRRTRGGFGDLRPAARLRPSAPRWTFHASREKRGLRVR